MLLFKVNLIYNSFFFVVFQSLELTLNQLIVVFFLIVDYDKRGFTATQ